MIGKPAGATSGWTVCAKAGSPKRWRNRGPLRERLGQIIISTTSGTSRCKKSVLNASLLGTPFCCKFGPDIGANDGGFVRGKAVLQEVRKDEIVQARAVSVGLKSSFSWPPRQNQIQNCHRKRLWFWDRFPGPVPNTNLSEGLENGTVFRSFFRDRKANIFSRKTWKIGVPRSVLAEAMRSEWQSSAG